MAEIVTDEQVIKAGERYFAMYVDRPGGAERPVVAELETGLVGPVSAEQARPRPLSGFEFPVLELVERAQRLAAEERVARILVIDPHGQMPLARIGYKPGR